MSPTQNSKPRIRVREATPADVDAIVTINYDAFGVDIMNDLMYPHGVDEFARSGFGARIFKAPDDKGQAIVMVAELLPEGTTNGTDEENASGEIVAFAKWLLYREPRTEQEWRTPLQKLETQETLGENCNVEVFNDFIGGMNRRRAEHSRGDPALFLSILACSTAHQRLGAGGALMRKGTALADELGLPSFLEASPLGYGLYRKHGYEDIDVHDLEITKRWGAVNTEGRPWGQDWAVEIAGRAPEGTFRTVIMKRPARTRAAV